MIKEEANIEIIRNNEGKLKSVKVVMPIWDKMEEDDFLSINVPLFGIKTSARDLADADVAVKESLEAFCINAEKFGKGLETELKIMGWFYNEETTLKKAIMDFSVNKQDVVLDQIMQTGEQFAEELQIAL